MRLHDDEKNGVTSTRSGSGGGPATAETAPELFSDAQFEAILSRLSKHDVDASSIAAFPSAGMDDDLFTSAAPTEWKPIKWPTATSLLSADQSSDMTTAQQQERLQVRALALSMPPPPPRKVGVISGSGGAPAVTSPTTTTNNDGMKLVFHTPAGIDDTQAVNILGLRLQSLEIQDFGPVPTGERPVVFHPNFLGDVLKTTTTTPTSPLDTLILHSPMRETWECLQNFYSSVGIHPRFLTFESPLLEPFLRNVERSSAATERPHALRDVVCLQLIDSLARPLKPADATSSGSDAYMKETFVGLHRTMPSVRHLSLLVGHHENHTETMRRYRAFCLAYGNRALKSLCVGLVSPSVIASLMTIAELPEWFHAVLPATDDEANSFNHEAVRFLFRAIMTNRSSTMRAISLTNLTALRVDQAFRNDPSMKTKRPEFPEAERKARLSPASTPSTPPSIRIVLRSDIHTDPLTQKLVNSINVYLSLWYETYNSTTLPVRRAVVEVHRSDARFVANAEYAAMFREQTLRLSSVAVTTTNKHKAESELVSERSPKRIQSPKTTSTKAKSPVASAQPPLQPLPSSTIQITKPLKWTPLHVVNGFPKGWIPELKAMSKPESLYPYADLFKQFSVKGAELEVLAVNCPDPPRSWTPKRLVSIRQPKEPISCLMFNGGVAIRHEPNNYNALDPGYGHVIFETESAKREIQLVSSNGAILRLEPAVSSRVYTLKLPPAALFDPVEFKIVSNLGARDLPITVIHKRSAPLFDYDIVKGGFATPFALIQHQPPPHAELALPFKYHVSDVCALRSWVQAQSDEQLRALFPATDGGFIRSRYQFVCRPLTRIESSKQCLLLCNSGMEPLELINNTPRDALSKSLVASAAASNVSTALEALKQVTFDRFDVDGRMETLLQRQQNLTEGKVMGKPLPFHSPAKLIEVSSLTNDQCAVLRARIAAWQVLLLSTSNTMLMAISTEDHSLGGNAICHTNGSAGAEVHFNPQLARNQYGYILMSARERLKASRASSSHSDPLEQLREIGRKHLSKMANDSHTTNTP